MSARQHLKKHLRCFCARSNDLFVKAEFCSNGQAFK
jgi:hypothetical protein